MSAFVCKTTGDQKLVIRLDKNFHVYIHGNRSKIEEGKDEKGKFVKLYYDESK